MEREPGAAGGPDPEPYGGGRRPDDGSPEDAPPPLHGVRVVDLTQVMAGPFCTMLLGDLGADVIKVEPPGRGDLSRSMGGAELRLRGDDNAPFLALNRNKRSVVLDLKDDAGREAFLALADSADVVVESFRPGVARRLGVDYRTLRERDPSLIYASVSGFGQTGPWSERPGFDLIIQGMSGIMSVTGEPDGDPVKCGVPVTDLAAGMFGVQGILAACLARERTGRGQRVETSLFEAALALSAWESTEYWATGRPPRAWGSAHRLSAPYQALRTADGYMTLAALTPRQWKDLCRALDRPELTADPRFRDNEARMENRAALAGELEATLTGAPTAAWVRRLLEAGVPAGPIYDYEQVFGHPHTRATEMVREIEHPVEGIVRTLGFPFKLSETPAAIRRPPPLLGEHTEEVLAELGAADPGDADRTGGPEAAGASGRRGSGGPDDPEPEGRT